MLLFLTPQTLLNAMAMTVTADLQEVATEALETATLALSSDLRTDFDYVAQTDIFLPGPNNPFYKFKLRQGLMNPTVTPVVTTYYTLEQIGEYEGTVINEYQFGNDSLFSPSLITPYCLFDNTKGVCTVQNLTLRNQVLTVQYSAGFNEDANDPTLYDQTSVPAWLVQLAKMRARIDLAAHPAFMDSKAVYNPKGLEEQYGTSVAKYARYVPDSVLAM